MADPRLDRLEGILLTPLAADGSEVPDEQNRLMAMQTAAVSQTRPR